MAKKKNNKKRNKNNKRGQKLSLKQWLSIFGIVVALIIFLPTTVILAVGMLPTLVAGVVDRHPGKNKTFTIGAMNFAGCFPYLLDVWRQANSMDFALHLVAQPKTIIVMYAAAAFGYGLNLVVTAIVAQVLVQKSELRIKKIDKEKQSLEERWGKGVQADPYASVSSSQKPSPAPKEAEQKAQDAP